MSSPDERAARELNRFLSAYLALVKEPDFTLTSTSYVERLRVLLLQIVPKLFELGPLSSYVMLDASAKFESDRSLLFPIDEVAFVAEVEVLLAGEFDEMNEYSDNALFLE